MREGQLKIFHVYITASKPRGVLYVGMTSDLAGRAWEHRERVLDGFTRKYWAGRLVYFEPHDTADSAAKRERLMKPGAAIGRSSLSRSTIRRGVTSSPTL